MKEDEIPDMVAIAQSSPGVMAVNASIIIGYRVAGIRGALATVFGTVLPPMVILSVISVFYRQFRDNRIVALVFQVDIILIIISCGLIGGIWSRWEGRAKREVRK